MPASASTKQGSGHVGSTDEEKKKKKKITMTTMSPLSNLIRPLMITKPIGIRTSCH